MQCPPRLKASIGVKSIFHGKDFVNSSEIMKISFRFWLRTQIQWNSGTTQFPLVGEFLDDIGGPIPWGWERLRAGGEGDDRGWDGWMASLTQWTWVWVDSGSWWWTGRPGVLWFMGSWRTGHDWATELNWITEHALIGIRVSKYSFHCYGFLNVFIHKLTLKFKKF